MFHLSLTELRGDAMANDKSKMENEAQLHSNPELGDSATLSHGPARAGSSEAGGVITGAANGRPA
jgi:hypothetical protein